ncbi:MAG: D-aminoacylase [Chloroflexi bacterium]|nr:D-aminoacylase [Chloroflexota bacterium]
MTFDTLILNGTVVDGTGRPAFAADVGIAQGRIAVIAPTGALAGSEAAQVIDASGLVVAPGFIDMHTHSDVSLLDDPGGESKAHQGVTTEVVGNCSFSPFPAGPAGGAGLQNALGSMLPSQFAWEWSDLDGWAAALETNGVSLNVAPLVGHGALRIAAGVTENRVPTDIELHLMQQLAAATVEQGAFGLTTGLTLPPSSFAKTDEIVALAKAVAGFKDAFYATHARVWAGWHVKAVEEAVEVGRRAGLPVQYSHMAIIDSRAFGHGYELVGVIERARQEGIDATIDAYPYTAAGTTLSQLIPEWVQVGGVAEMLKRLRNPLDRQQAQRDTAQGWFGGMPWEWDKLVISDVHTARNQHVIGQSLAQIAQERKADAADTLLALIDEEDNYVRAVMHNRVEGDARFFLSHPQTMIGSDGKAISPTGQYATAKPHPRFYGTFPRILGRYVRDTPLFSLETAIYKMTGFPAQRLGLKERGLIAPNLYADVVIFNPDTVIDRATFENPQQYPVGISYVFVNGQPIVAQGRHTGARPGRVLRRSRG